jgi:hypothetical protein
VDYPSNILSVLLSELLGMGTTKRRVAAYLLDEVARYFDDFKRQHGIEGDSHAINQILMRFFNIAETDRPPSDVLERLVEVEKTLRSLGQVGHASLSDSVSLDLDETQVDSAPIAEKEVAKSLNISEKKLKGARTGRTEDEYNTWLLASSSGFEEKYRYSFSSRSYFLLARALHKSSDRGIPD